MERIDLFDRYIKGELSEAERSEFRSRLESDQDFESEFNVYMLTVSGICKEAEQDNLEFGAAMNGLTREELFEIIGRKPKVLSRDEIAAKLRDSYPQNERKAELSGMAALDNSDDDDFEPEPTAGPSTGSTNKVEDKSGNSMKTFTLIFIGIVILLILIAIFL